MLGYIPVISSSVLVDAPTFEIRSDSCIITGHFSHKLVQEFWRRHWGGSFPSRCLLGCCQAVDWDKDSYALLDCFFNYYILCPDANWYLWIKSLLHSYSVTIYLYSMIVFLSCVHFGMFYIKKTKRFYSQSTCNLKTLKLYTSKLLRLQIEPCNSKMRHLFIYTWPSNTCTLCSISILSHFLFIYYKTWPSNTCTLFYILFFLFITKLDPLTPALYYISILSTPLFIKNLTL